MATAKKLSRKELKQPDEFIQTGQTVFEWIGAHRQLVVGAVAISLVLGLMLAVGTWWVDRREASAAGELGSALEIASRPVIEDATQAQAAGAPFFESEQARTEAYKAALEAVRKDHPGTESAAMAALQLGDLAYDAKDYDGAKAQYETFLKEAPSSNDYRFAAMEGLGLVATAQGDLEGAVKEYQRLVDEGNAFYTPFALVRLGETLQTLGKTDEARTKAQRVLDEFGSSPARRDAENLLERLGPAPAPETAAPASEG